MALSRHPAELTASFTNRNILAHHFLATPSRSQAKANSERSFLFFIFLLKKINEHYVYSEDFLGDSGLGQNGLVSRRTCLLGKGRISVCAETRQEEGEGQVGTMRWVCLAPLTEVVTRHPCAPLCPL